MRSCQSCCWPLSERSRRCPACRARVPGAPPAIGRRLGGAAVVVVAAGAVAGGVALGSGGGGSAGPRDPAPAAAAASTTTVADSAPARTPTTAAVRPANRVGRPASPRAAAPASATTRPVTTAAPVTTPATATTPATRTATTPAPARRAPAKPVPLHLQPSDASTYNPDQVSATAFGDPAAALTGAWRGAWTYRLDPSTGGRAGVGLLIRLPAPRAIGAITLHTDSPGMAVALYGTAGAVPSTLAAGGWIRLATRGSVLAATTVTLTRRPRLDAVLVWIERPPPDTTVGTLDIKRLAIAAPPA